MYPPLRKTTNAATTMTTPVRPVYRANELPRARIHKPEAWREQVERLHPLEENPDGVWLCTDGDCAVYTRDPSGRTSEEGIRYALPFTGHCPVCFKEAPKRCGKCGSVSYCSAVCQKKHWKQSHKKVCAGNPRFYQVSTDLNVFRPIGDAVSDAFTGYEFLKIKPTSELPDLTAICQDALEGADDIMEIPGFGHSQLQLKWVMENRPDTVYQALVRKYGWTSGHYSVDLVEGYRFAEDTHVYLVLSDDCFANPAQSPGLAESYYGGMLFPSTVRRGQAVRGNIVVFKLMLKNKQWKTLESSRGSLMLIYTDDANLHYEYEMYPLCKAEVAHMLMERSKAMKNDGYTRRMWRAVQRSAERQIENQRSP